MLKMGNVFAKCPSIKMIAYHSMPVRATNKDPFKGRWINGSRKVMVPGLEIGHFEEDK
jgi:hypothetical protein